KAGGAAKHHQLSGGILGTAGGDSAPDFELSVLDAQSLVVNVCIRPVRSVYFDDDVTVAVDEGIKAVTVRVTVGEVVSLSFLGAPESNESHRSFVERSIDTSAGEAVRVFSIIFEIQTKSEPRRFGAWLFAFLGNRRPLRQALNEGVKIERNSARN